MGKKAREARRETFAPARLNSDGFWQDVCIRNISSRGMMLEVQQPPPRGHYLEVRRGVYVIVGRVVWSTDYRAGIVTQDRIDIDAILANAKVPPRRPGNSGNLVERRKTPRHAERHEHSRLLGRTMEYGSFLLLGAVGAVLAMDVAGAALRAPLQQVESALNGP